MDVFVAPRRSRKQRGWFQVIRVNKVEHPYRHDSQCPSQLQECHRSTPISGSDIPQELLMHLIGVVVHEQNWAPDASRKSASELSNLSMVCRHWAPLVRPFIFKKVTVDTAQQLMQLSDFLHSPISRIREYIQDVRVSFPSSRVTDGVKAVPFLHLLPSLISRLKHSTRITESYPYLSTVTVSAGTQRVQRIRSIHWLLPVRLPRTSFAGIARLVVHDTSFRLFSDLAQLVFELPALDRFEASGLTWTTFEDPSSTIPIRLQRARLRERPVSCSGDNCSQLWPLIWLSALVWCNSSDAHWVRAIAQIVESAMNGLSDVRATINSQFVRSGFPQRCT